jgi:hypothetical protein
MMLFRKLALITFSPTRVVWIVARFQSADGQL